ncbi:MAG TPA: 6,7-dimethyl-8-ribityllumazine synthase [Parafilimonas sp.]|jgi:6,7-dimethyl-8-ribityllumazine synthase|nr:6,7-dimethyl-8-ribityllumazine synthase [Parafilimonas sp.]
MSTTGNNALQKGIPRLKDAFIVIVKTEWNKNIVDKLESGAITILQEQNIKYRTVTVPGSFEIPFAVRAYAHGKKKADAFIALGTVIRGDTPHFDYVCKAITDGVLSLNLMLDVPVIFGVLTVNDEQQANDRAGGAHGNKGEEAAITAIKMIVLNRKLKK